MRLPANRGVSAAAITASALAILLGVLTVAILLDGGQAHGAPVSPSPAASAEPSPAPSEAPSSTPSASTVPPSPADSRPASVEPSTAPAGPDAQRPLSSTVLAAIVVAALVLLVGIAVLMLRGRRPEDHGPGSHRH